VSLQGGSERIRLIGRALDAEVRADSLVAARDADLATAAQFSVPSYRAPRVLFVYARGQRVVHVAGTATAADAAIRSAGARNAITQFEGFRPLTAEGVVAAAPDVVLMLVHGAESLGGEDGIFALPGMMLTPAGRARRLILADDLALLGFGPRYGRAVLDIARALHANADLSRRNP
jgi:iron complex transport system substrate-binding protein